MTSRGALNFIAKIAGGGFLAAFLVLLCAIGAS